MKKTLKPNEIRAVSIEYEDFGKNENKPVKIFFHLTSGNEFFLNLYNVERSLIVGKIGHITTYLINKID
jgi:hypothetical protein